MKKFFTLLAAAAAMTLTAGAETVTFQMGANDGAVILQDGKFNPLGSFIGNTGTNTIIEVGEVDFATGDAYKAVSIRYANGWSNGGKAIISVGADADNRTEIARMDLINWNDSYTNFRSLGVNLGDVLPTGVQKVYLTFEDRAGNIQDVRFYSEAFTADQFENGSLLKEPCNQAGYDQMATVLDINNSKLVYSSSSDTRIDNGSWGWTGEGVVVKYGDLDFGSGDYKQVVLELASHWQGDQKDHSVDVYIDDYNNDANKIANVWTGIDVKAKLYLARNIEAISGTHTVYLKWHGGSANIANVHFVKDCLYSLGNIVDPVVLNPINETPSENASRYSFRDGMKNSEEAVYVGRDSGRTTILNQGQWEGNNVGYTGGHTVLKITDVDFEDGRFNEILVTHATGSSWLGYVNDANFKFYIDLNEEGVDWGNAQAAFADVEPIATVWMQATGGWGNEYTTKGDLSQVTGVHNLYIIYTASDGANVKDIYLDGPAPAVKSAINFNAEMENATVEVLVVGEAIESGAEVAEGTEVTVVVTPADGYKVAGVTVETAAPSAAAGAPRRAAVDVEEAGNNTYTFVMPAEAVTVNVEVEETVVTAVTDINVANSAAVKYVNAQGQVSDRPFQGINIVIEGNKAYKIVK